MTDLKFFRVLLGWKPNGRHTEQHDVFFGIAPSLKSLLPQMQAFWPDSGKLHIDAWREVTIVEGFIVEIIEKTEPESFNPQKEKLFFVNLGGYQKDKFEEQHYTLLTVKPDRAAAMREAKDTLFFQHNHYGSATSHIDDKYGIDVDDLYEIEDILTNAQKELYRISLRPATGQDADQIHLGYLKLSALE